MAIKVFIQFEVKHELLDVTLKSFEEALPETMAFDGCLGIEVLQDSENPNQITFDELWESQDHQLKYFKWREETGFTEKMMAVITGPPVIKYFNILGSY